MMNDLKIWFLFLCFSFSFFYTNGQLSLEDFQLGGAAQKINDQCIRLVPDYQYTAGSAWYKKPIDLTYPFEMEVCLVLGEKDLDGADGIVFVFHPNFARTGWRGEGMGFAGLIPSLGIEFDTYLNYHLFDPEEDHIAVMVNGQTYHGRNSFQPVTVPNLEDGGRHLMRILWDPQAKTLEVFLDGTSQVVYEADIINNVFRGGSVVYWGVTAATGRLSNNHEICIKKLVFTDATEKSKSKGLASLEVENPMNAMPDLDVQFFPNTTAFYPKSVENLNALVAYLKAHPKQNLQLMGHVAEAEVLTANAVLSQKRLRAVLQYLEGYGIGKERLVVKELENDQSTDLILSFR